MRTGRRADKQAPLAWRSYAMPGNGGAGLVQTGPRSAFIPSSRGKSLEDSRFYKARIHETRSPHVTGTAEPCPLNRN